MPASLILLFCSIFFSCASLPQQSPEALSAAQEKLSLESSYIPSQFEWTPLCRGIETFRFEDKEIPLVYHVVRIDLTEPTLRLCCVKGSVPSAVRKTSCRIAFNATQFETKFLLFNRLKGVCRIEGEEISKPIEKYAALLFRALGCKDAMEFDGGHSSALYVDGKNVLDGYPWRNSLNAILVLSYE